MGRLYSEKKDPKMEGEWSWSPKGLKTDHQKVVHKTDNISDVRHD